MGRMAAEQPFDLDRFLALPRLERLAASPDGRRLVTAVGAPDPDGKRFTSALWEIDPAGHRAPRRLTRSAAGESDPQFCPDGTLLFTSARRRTPDGDGDGGGDGKGLWALPAGGGEAFPVAAPPGGVDAFAVGRHSGTIVVGLPLHPGADSWQADAAAEQARTDAGVTAQLYTSYPLRYWDRWLGPRARHVAAGPPPTPGVGDGQDPAAGHGWVTVTADPGRALDRVEFDVTPDGATVVTGWLRDPDDLRDVVVDLVAVPVDRAPAAPRVLASARAAHESPACSPDGRAVVCVVDPLGTPGGPADRTLVLIDLSSGRGRDLLPGFDRWPQHPVWSPDGQAVFFTADDDGHRLPFRVDVAAGTVTRLAASGSFTDLCPAPDGSALYALRSSLAAPPAAVALDPHAADAEPRALPCPGDDRPAPPACVERVEACADDGTRVPGWLVLPGDAGPDAPAPLATFIHGGPLASWNGWHWRWNPHLLVARGWAVLCPDPALSTGYGLDYIRRGWGRWGAEPYRDLMAIVEAVAARPDVDGGRLAALGGSFGGYMANWVAGHSERFSAIVSHASIWNLEAFHGMTDLGAWWENEFGDRYREPERYRQWSPHRHVGAIRTPMLVIHGERDFRVPVGEGLALWTDLRRHGVDAAYLHFPDEHHWVTRPQHVRLWYETVAAFLDHHVLGRDWQRPKLL